MCIANNIEKSKDNDEVEVDFGMNVNDEEIVNTSESTHNLLKGAECKLE